MRESPWGSSRRGYHHGNLRETLIEAARHLIAINGTEGFSLIEAARLAEVSPAAPYRHFPDRKALVEAVGERGFLLFGERLQQAGAGTDDPMLAFRRMGAAYLAFAREEPGYYSAMFEAHKAKPPVEGSGASAFDILADAVRRVIRGGAFDDRRVRVIALQVWALSHGIAMLGRSGDLPAGPRLPGPEELLDNAVTALIKGHCES